MPCIGTFFCASYILLKYLTLGIYNSILLLNKEVTNMKISTRGRYGLKAMVDIAAQCSCKNCNCVNLKSIAERQGISEHYLEQLISPLKKAGLVKSIRGAKGGYTINKDPKDISVGEVLRVLEGSLYPVACLEDGKNCYCGNGDCVDCVTKPVWEKVYQSLTGVLNAIMLQDLVDNYKK